ncbi:MAG: hypothetical protein P1V97_21275 [Planctomycetota bacterium]|nr:hypothetical protein [Planctomycetota bacterium]
MAKLARQIYHQVLEEVLTWLEFLQETDDPVQRDWRLFTGEILPKFTSLLPDLISALNEASSSPIDGEPLLFSGMTIEAQNLPKTKIPYEMISARIRRRPGTDIRERQCIGPIIGERGRCVGRGAATAGWQLESPENFARKRNNFQARCKACDTLRTQGRQLKLTRRSAAARHWLEVRERAEEIDLAGEQWTEFRRELLGLSLTFLEELRSDWWNTLQHLAHRLIQVSGHLPKEPWLAVDVDRKLIFPGESPEAAKSAGHLDDNLLVVFHRFQVSQSVGQGGEDLFQ